MPWNIACTRIWVGMFVTGTIFIHMWQLWNLLLGCHVEICFLKKTTKMFAQSFLPVANSPQTSMFYSSWLVFVNESLGWTVLGVWGKSLGNCVGQCLNQKRGLNPPPSVSLLAECHGLTILFRPWAQGSASGQAKWSWTQQAEVTRFSLLLLEKQSSFPSHMSSVESAHFLIDNQQVMTGWRKLCDYYIGKNDRHK